MVNQYRNGVISIGTAKLYIWKSEQFGSTGA
jgi:hypothetical protein